MKGNRCIVLAFSPIDWAVLKGADCTWIGRPGFRRHGVRFAAKARNEGPPNGSTVFVPFVYAPQGTAEPLT